MKRQARAKRTAGAGASTNYIERANKCRCLMTVVQGMAKDTALAEPAAYRAALEEFDRAIADGGVSVGYSSVSRCCPLTARAVLGKCGQFSEKVRADAAGIASIVRA